MEAARRPALHSGGFAWGHRRVAAGISIRQLAKEAGINKGTLSYVERGRMIPTAEEYEKVNAALARLIVPEA